MQDTHNVSSLNIKVDAGQPNILGLDDSISFCLFVLFHWHRHTHRNYVMRNVAKDGRSLEPLGVEGSLNATRFPSTKTYSVDLDTEKGSSSEHVWQSPLMFQWNHV